MATKNPSRFHWDRDRQIWGWTDGDWQELEPGGNETIDEACDRMEGQGIPTVVRRKGEGPPDKEPTWENPGSFNPARERLYHVVAIGDSGRKEYMTRTPATHAECVTMMGKISKHPKRRIQLEEVTENPGRLKIRPDHLEAMRAAIAGHRDQVTALREASTSKGLSDARFRWEVFHRVIPRELNLELYEYLNDENIDAAMRQALGRSPHANPAGAVYLTCSHCEANFKGPKGGALPAHNWRGAACPGAGLDEHGKKPNPAGLTAKGERMYEHIKKSYGDHPRAKELAARTVRGYAFEGTPGLVKPKKNPYQIGDESKLFGWVHQGCARMLWVAAYADFVDNIEDDEERDNWPRAGGGENWNDYAPETPSSAEDAATVLLGFIEKANGCTIAELLRRAAQADGVRNMDNILEDYAESFGGDLAMMGTGTGVSWFDDHEKFDLKIPFTYEAHTFDGETLDYSGRV